MQLSWRISVTFVCNSHTVLRKNKSWHWSFFGDELHRAISFGCLVLLRTNLLNIFLIYRLLWSFNMTIYDADFMSISNGTLDRGFYCDGCWFWTAYKGVQIFFFSLGLWFGKCFWCLCLAPYSPFNVLSGPPHLVHIKYLWILCILVFLICWRPPCPCASLPWSFFWAFGGAETEF